MKLRILTVQHMKILQVTIIRDLDGITYLIIGDLPKA